MRADLPTPQSWYAVAFSDELAPGALLTRRLAGGDIIVFRTQGGVVGVSDPFCPHLGAHLGVGGTVEGETLHCPFHGFRFATTGACVATGYGTRPPPRARLRMWRCREVNEIIFVWYDPAGGMPHWEPPPLDTRGWTPLIHTTFDLRDHVQETVENSVDISRSSTASVQAGSKAEATDDVGCHTLGVADGLVDGEITGEISFMDPLEAAEEGAECCVSALAGIAVNLTLPVTVIVSSPFLG